MFEASAGAPTNASASASQIRRDFMRLSLGEIDRARDLNGRGGIDDEGLVVGTLEPGLGLEIERDRAVGGQRDRAGKRRRAALEGDVGRAADDKKEPVDAIDLPRAARGDDDVVA